MAARIFAAVGSFAMRPGTSRGIHIFSYEAEHGTFTKLGDYCREVNAGQRAYDAEKDVLYVTDETRDADGEPGSGGRILAFKPDHKTGTLKLIGERRTCGANPSYVLLEAGGDALLIPHHGTGNLVTKIRREKDGRFRPFADTEDTAVSLFPILPDGSPGEMEDAFFLPSPKETHEPQTGALPHLHNCIQSPDGRLIVICDKGQDIIHTCRFDRETRKLIPLASKEVETGSHPRYGIFHPTLPILYTNCENSAFLHVWKYDGESGELGKLQTAALLEDETAAASWRAEGASDLVLTADGRFLYAAMRGLNRIAVFSVLEDGAVSLLEDVDCQGKNPRGLCLSPDERYLFSMNRDSDCIAGFRIGEDGKLTAEGIKAECSFPGNLIFISYEEESEKPFHVRETKSQKWKQDILPLGKVMPEFPYAKLFRFRENVYSFFLKSFDGHGDPWIHLIAGPSRALLIDTGFGIGDLKAAVNRLIGDRELLVANTHPHIDHAYGNAQFDRVYVHKHALPYLALQNEHMWDPLCDENGKGIWRDFSAEDKIPFRVPEYIPCENHHIFDLGEGHEVEMIFLPGHNCAHCAFLDKKNRILFGGDTLLYVCGIAGVSAPGMPYAEYGTVEALKEELEKLVPRMGEFDCIFMSHMVLGAEKSLVSDLYKACCAVLEDPDSNEFVHEQKGRLNKVKTCGTAALEYRDETIYKNRRK